MLVRCLYASHHVTPLAAELLDDILAQSRRNNPRHGITGLLCYTKSIFVQVIEGGRNEVCELFNRIIRDERHRDVRLLAFEEIAERRFASWTMGQVNVDQINAALLLKYSTRAELDPFDAPGQATMALLLELIATNSIVTRKGT